MLGRPFVEFSARSFAHRAFCASETFLRAAADKVRRGPLAPLRADEALLVPASGAKAAIAWSKRSRSCCSSFTISAIFAIRSPSRVFAPCLRIGRSILHIWPIYWETSATPYVDSFCLIVKVQAFLAPFHAQINSHTPPNKEQSPIIPQIEKLLTEQTSVILQAVDEKLSAQDKRMEEKFIAQEIRILAAVDKRLAKTEERFAKSLDELTKTIDKFLKRLTDIEEEFTFMKEDLKRVKAVLREKLGVSLD